MPLSDEIARSELQPRHSQLNDAPVDATSCREGISNITEPNGVEPLDIKLATSSQAGLHHGSRILDVISQDRVDEIESLHSIWGAQSLTLCNEMPGCRAMPSLSTSMKGVSIAAPRSLASRVPATAVGAMVSINATRSLIADGIKPDVAGLSWQQACFITLGDFIGIGFLLIPGAFANLGYFWGTTIFAVCSIIPWYTSTLLRRFKQHILPSVSSYQDATLYLSGGKTSSAMSFLIEFGFVLNMVLGFSLAHTSATNILQMFSGVRVSFNVSLVGAAVVAAVLWPASQIRTLAGASWTSAMSSLAVFLASLLALGVLFKDLDVQHTEDEKEAAPTSPAVPEQIITFSDTFVAPVLAIVLYYFSHDTAFEIMDAMTEPASYQKAHTVAYLIAAPTALVISLAAISLADPLLGEYPDLVDNLTNTHIPWLTVVAFSLIAFKGISLYLVLNTIILQTWTARIKMWANSVVGGMSLADLSIACHHGQHLPMDVIEEESEDRETYASNSAVSLPPSNATSVSGQEGVIQCRKKTRMALFVQECNPAYLWAVMSTGILLISFLVVYGFPYLDILADITAALTASPIVFIFPAWFFLRGNKLLGNKIRLIDSIMCYSLMYVIGPAVSLFGLASVVINALNEYTS